MKPRITPVLTGLVFVLSLPLISTSALAHSESKHDEHAKKMDYANAEEHEFGKAADPKKAVRTVVVKMSDQMRFTPDVVEVKRGEVVRFEIHNNGKLMHEMVLGTTEGLQSHAAMMKKFPGMEHDEPYMAHVKPAHKMNMGWQFTKAGEYFYGCLVPGHFEAGMKGKIVVQ